MYKVKNKSVGEDEKITRLFDSYSNFVLDGSEKLDSIEKSSRFHSADITCNIDKWGQDIPFELINSDVNSAFLLIAFFITLNCLEGKNRNCVPNKQ